MFNLIFLILIVPIYRFLPRFGGEKHRFFVLEKDGMISYYKSEIDFQENPMNKKGEIKVQFDSVISQDGLKSKCCFVIQAPDTYEFHLECGNQENTDMWISKINIVIDSLNSNNYGNIHSKIVARASVAGAGRATLASGGGGVSSRATVTNPKAAIVHSYGIQAGDHDNDKRDDAVRASTVANQVMWRGKPLNALGIKYLNILVDRVGKSPDAFMTTDCILAEIDQNSYYRITFPNGPGNFSYI